MTELVIEDAEACQLAAELVELCGLAEVLPVAPTE